MTRSDYVQVCSQCKHRKFDRYEGVVCGLTDKIADFQSTCPSYSRDVNIEWKRPTPPLFTVDKAAGRKHTLIGAILIVLGSAGVMAGDFIGAIGFLITGIIEFVHGQSQS